jgi:HD-GYP domain-containing protein (c-di-GMP phosphodiesterase class II)
MADREKSSSRHEWHTDTKLLIDLCLALSKEKDVTRLLELIVTRSRQLTCAEAGSLYIVEPDHLTFEILQNDPMNLYFRKTDGRSAPMPSVPLYHPDGKPNHTNVSTWVALTGKTVHIEDVYDSDHFEFSGVRRYDASSGFHSRSMLTIPLIGYKGEIVAVLQLINRKNPVTHEIGPFLDSDIEIMEAIASQAAVAIVKARLIHELQALLLSFVKAIAWAVDAKSHFTGTHIDRVAHLTMKIARMVNDSNDDFFKTVQFSEDEMEELRYAAWMHDIGKIVTPWHLIDKGSKLEQFSDNIALIRQRFATIKLLQEVAWLKAGKQDRQALEKEIEAIDQDLAFICQCNEMKIFMDDANLERLREIQERTYTTDDGQVLPWLTQEEFLALSIRKGTLTSEERQTIEDHVVMTREILNHLQFPAHLANVPRLAASHHEKPNGKGYPDGLTDEQIPLQAKIMAIADVYEALTAADRPYKKAMTPAQATDILLKMKENNEIDGRLFDLCQQNGIFDERP